MFPIGVLWPYFEKLSGDLGKELPRIIISQGTYDKLYGDDLEVYGDMRDRFLQALRENQDVVTL